MAIIAAIVVAEAIKDLLNAVLGSSPFSPKYSTNGKLSMGHSIRAIFIILQPIVKLSLFILNFPYTPIVSLTTLFSE
jgi:hypothetical protein